MRKIAGLAAFAVIFFAWNWMGDDRTFSSTMEWDPKFFALSEGQTYYGIDRSEIKLPPPPANSSSETKKELEILLGYRSLRTSEKIEQIKKEAEFDTTEFGGRPGPDYFDEKKFPATARLLKESYHDLSVIVTSEKRKFDRVRPHILEPDLDPAIEVPGHPAYPSGHSTKSHFLAFVLGELRPKEREALAARADEIARNREIAGLHYPSDSRAGALLARQFADLLFKNAEFQALLAPARSEWRQ
jgi:acid phosphatase (class A)